MDKFRAAKLLARNIEIDGIPATPSILLDPYPLPMPFPSSPCWLWTGAFRPRLPNAHQTNQLGLINFPRPITTIGGVERNPVKPLMCLQCDLPLSEEPDRIFRRCNDRRCVNPYHHKANVASNATLRNIFP
jgi:hypothetical protein